MKICFYRSLTAVSLIAGVLGHAGVSDAYGADNALKIGTGGKGGVYYPAGRAICRMLKESGDSKCVAKISGGSLINLVELRSGDINVALVQSDWQFHSYKGSSKFRRMGPDAKLRSVFALHSEMFTIVARADAGVRKLSDLMGKRVNIGNPGSGARGTMEVVMRAMGWKKKSFAMASELPVEKQSQALCNDRIDAMVFTVGHPSEFVRNATTKCQSVLVPVSGGKIDRLVKKLPYYSQTWIPAGIYKGSIRKTKTFGVNATLVARADVPERRIRELVAAVFEHLCKFKSQHPALKLLNKRDMVRHGLSAPLHPGAVSYYKSAGLL